MTRFLAPAALALLCTASAPAGEIDRGLREVLGKAAPGETVSALVYLEQLDLATLHRDLETRQEPRAVRHEWVVSTLQDMAAATQGPLLEHLKGLLDQGRIDSYQPYWIVNAVRVIATKDELEALAARADVLLVFYDIEIEGIQPINVQAGAGGAGAGGPEQGLVAVRAPEAWALGFTGQDVLVSSLDTGVDGNHPALASRWRGLDAAYAGHPEWAWFDPVTNTTFPQAFGFHGTHTMGTICGGAPGNQVGVAPGSDWIHAAVIDRVSIPQTVSDAILSFQWLIDPDENPATVFDVPKVNSNSWGLADFHGYADCDQLFWTFLDACEAAGTVMTFAAGNEGFQGLRRPADRATDDYRTFAVAAVNGNVGGFPIAGFSSRGPTNCTPGGGNAIKPDIAAPGVGVVSSVPGGGYSSSDGTSMATPHIAGVVALIYSANPDLSVEQVKQIMYDTAADLGPAGQDNDYGWGITDAFEAVLAALATINLTFSFPDGQPNFIDPAGGTTIPVIVSGQQAIPAPGTGQLYYSTDGQNYTQIAMTEGAPNAYDAIFPELPCGAAVSYYFSADDESGKTVYNPFTAPAQVYHGDAYTGYVTTFTDTFELDQGWTTEVLGATSGQWQRGVPINDPNWQYDPISDGDGSGQCWLTQNQAGDTDVDDGSVRLISPEFDLTPAIGVGTIAIQYLYYLNIADGNIGDQLVVEISSNGAAGPWAAVARYGANNGLDWTPDAITEIDLANQDIALTDTMVLRFTASDVGSQATILEAGVDGISVTMLWCNLPPTCPFDLDDDGTVGINDLLDLLAAWGDPYGINDLLDLLAAWGPC